MSGEATTGEVVQALATRVIADPSAPSSASRPRRWLAIRAVQTLVAFVATFHSLGHKSLWMDEGFSYAAAKQPLGSLLTLITRDETNMGAYYLVLHFWEHLGRSEASLRALSA